LTFCLLAVAGLRKEFLVRKSVKFREILSSGKRIGFSLAYKGYFILAFLFKLGRIFTALAPAARMAEPLPPETVAIKFQALGTFTVARLYLPVPPYLLLYPFFPHLTPFLPNFSDLSLN